jgi:CHAT domain-containing protein
VIARRVASHVAILFGVACADPRDVATSPASIAEHASRETRVLSSMDSLLRHADSVYLRAPDSSTAIYQAALDQAEAAGDSVNIARGLTGLGQAARQAGDFPTSRVLGERALALKLRRGMRADLFRSYNALGLLAWREGRVTDASLLLAKAAAAARATNDSVAMAKVEVNVGLVLIDAGDFDGARRALVAGRDGARAVGDTATLGKALNNLAALDITLGNPLPAIEGLETARRLFAEAGDSIGEVNALGQVAAAHDALGEPRRAFAALDSALGMARRHGMRVEEADDLKLLGDLYRDAGYYQHALDVYARSSAINDSLDKPEERGNLLRDEARIHFALGGVTRARQRATDALRVHQTGPFRYAQLADHLLLAELAQHANQPAEADAHLRSAHDLASSLGASIASADVALAEARVRDQAGQPERVLRVLDAARPMLAQAGNNALAESEALTARAYARLGRTALAVTAGRAAVAAVERVRGNYGSGELRTAYASSRAAVYGDLVVALLRLGRTEEAFEVADAARGRGLLEHLSTARSEAEAASGPARTLVDAEALLRRIDELTAKLRVKEQTLPRERTPAHAATTRELNERLRQARGEYEEMLARRARDGTGAVALIGGGRASARAVQASLEPGELLLEYFVTPERLLIFAATRSGLTSTTSDVSAEDLASRVRLARDLLTARTADDARTRRVLGGLHSIVFRPVAAVGVLRGVRRIIVVSHAVLTYLPLAALVDTATGRYVAQDFAIAHVPSAAALPLLRAESREAYSAAPRAAVFAPFPAELPATLGEARSVRASVTGAAVRIGGEATEARLREALASGAIVHVATHGVMNARNPLFSRLELATRDSGGSELSGDDNGRLEVHELLNLHFQSPLVFLSGCETGLGASWTTGFETGQDYTTIEQALLFAGARNVVATLWSIDDEGAAELARRFYAARRSLGAAEALAQAQREMIAEPRWRSPYLWAAYEVSGGGIEGARPEKISAQSVKLK